ncbi:MAG: adenylate kinase [Lachnospiraceae bacterium]
MNKVLIIGCPGSGKSTFARALRDKTHLPLYYLDMIWHKPDQTTVTAAEFDRQLTTLLCQPQWIIDGNYLRTMELRLKQCDTVFLLDIPLETCLAGAESRIGQKREDLPWVEYEFDREFKQWICDFRSDQLPQIYELLKKYNANKKIIVFKTRQEIDKYIEQL